jgi:uncharacterized protein (UPF0212 family)
MGMYDEIKGNFWCPFCGQSLNEMQTKSLDQVLDSMTLIEFKERLHEHAKKTGKYVVGEIHDSCDHCHEFVSLQIAVSPEDIV